jgi:serine/threonine-protein kinase
LYIKGISARGSRSTEHYVEGTLAGKPGVGLYLDAAPGVRARALAIQTPTPGLTAAVYAANHFDSTLPSGDTTPLTQRGWTQVAAPQKVAGRTTIALSDPSGGRYRYYLFWITALPPGSEVAEVAEATLLA